MLFRKGEHGLHDDGASNKTAQDMKGRSELLNRGKAACVVSIHQNSYHEESVRGAQVFYYGTSKESEQLAKLLQTELIRVGDPESARQARANDTYYLLKKTAVPTVIVECGFLSNWEDCAKLQDENYQDRLVWAIHMGILKYMNS